MQKSDSELRTEDTKAPDVKTRSRLSSAFRSLRSKKKVPRPEREASSGTEDPKTPLVKRKSRFSLSGIRPKTKVHPDNTLKVKKPSEDYLSATSDTTPSHKFSPKKSLKKKLKTKKLVVTEDPSDIPPVSQAPPKPDRSYTGAVRKVTTTVNNSELMKREDRGSRFPRPSSATEEDQSASASSSPPKHSFQPIEPQPSQSKDSQSEKELPPGGNNIQNPNLSGAIGSDPEESRKKIIPTLVFDLEKEEDGGGSLGVAEIDEMPSYGDLVMDPVEPQIMTTQTKEIREHLYKILVIGELGTGKTSFIKRYVHQFFSQNYRATIGVDFALKVLHWDQNTIVRLQLWDIAGQERFGNMTRVYYKEAVGAFIVYDVTRNATFDCVSKWKQDLDSKVQLPDGSPIPCILLANKCDLENQGNAVDPVKMDEYCKENNFAGWYETSAKENVNIDEAARALVNKILLNDKLISASDIADSEKINLGTANGQTTAKMLKEKCSC